DVALLHIQNRRRKHLATHAPGKRDEQKSMAQDPMPWRTQHHLRDRVEQGYEKPGWLAIVDSRRGLVHLLSLSLLFRDYTAFWKTGQSHCLRCQCTHDDLDDRVSAFEHQRLRYLLCDYEIPDDKR